MTIRNTRRTSSDFEIGTQYLTSDGKLVTLKHVCIEEHLPKIDISDAKRGDTFVLRCGEKFVCDGELYQCGPIRSWQGVDPEARKLWFRFNGSCPSYGANMEVVELIRAREPEKPRIDISDAAKGDTLILRGGKEYICTGVVSSDKNRWRAVSEGGHALWFDRDGSCAGYSDGYHVVGITKTPEPRVSLEGLRVGEQFRVRNGEVFTCTRLDSYGSPIRAKSTRYPEGSYFGFDGRACPAREEIEAVERLPFIEPRVSLDDLKVGGRFRTRDGQVFTCTSINKNSAYAIYACSERHSSGLFFLRNGHCNLGESPLEAVEVLEPSVVETIRFQLQKLGKAEVDRIVVSEKDWQRLEAEVKKVDADRIDIDGVRVLYNSNTFEAPPGWYDIRLKLD